MLENLISRWPLLRQIRTGADGTGPEAMSAATRNLRSADVRRVAVLMFDDAGTDS